MKEVVTHQMPSLGWITTIVKRSLVVHFLAHVVDVVVFNEVIIAMQ